MKRVVAVFLILLLFCSIVAVAQGDKLDLRYDWLWGWQFYKDGKWHNVGLFASALRRAVSDVPEAVEVIDEVNMISLGTRLASVVGGAITLTSYSCGYDIWGNYRCAYGPLYLLGAILSGGSHVTNQIIQGIYFHRAIRIYNEST